MDPRDASASKNGMIILYRTLERQNCWQLSTALVIPLPLEQSPSSTTILAGHPSLFYFLVDSIINQFVFLLCLRINCLLGNACDQPLPLQEWYSLYFLRLILLFSSTRPFDQPISLLQGWDPPRCFKGEFGREVWFRYLLSLAVDFEIMLFQ